LQVKIATLQQQQTAFRTTRQSNFDLNQAIDYTDNEVNVLRNTKSEVHRKIDELIADTHHDAIKFNGFGFRRYNEAAAWLETHSPDHKFGLIVDVHMVFEHLYSAAEKTVPALQQLKKIEMTNMSQGIAVSFFDQPIPKLLCEGTGYSVVQTNESYFDHIKSYKEWDTPHKGYRVWLKHDLGSFDAAHRQLVTNCTIPQSPLQATASLSCSYSISWIEAFIIFIDDTYDELTQAKFLGAREWSLIARLAYRILVEVSAPRNGIKHSFITGRNDLIAKQIWSVIQSHDLMASYKSKSFKNDPSVSSKYVMNTGMDLVDQLVKRVTTLEELVKGLIKDVKVAELKSSSASNGVSSITKTIEALVKRVASLESKK
jgi:lysozyme family protein